MHNTENKRTAAQLGQVTDLFLALEDDYDDGIRKAQDCFSYFIFLAASIPDEQDEILPEEKRENVMFLREMTRRFREMETILHGKNVES